MVGRWGSPFRLVITNRVALRESRLRAVDRLQVEALAAMNALGAAPQMTTTVGFDPDCHECRVLHTTRISSAGVTLFRSEEWLTLDDDGRGAVLRGAQRSAPTLWIARPWAESTVRFDEDGQGAHYALTWLGVPLRQVTRVVPEGVRLTQETAWSRAEALLQRVAAR